MRELLDGFPYVDVQSELNCETIKNIYFRMKDETSRKIFINRLMFSLTEDAKYIREVILCTTLGKKLDYLLSNRKEIYVYGAGMRGTRLIQLFPEKNWIGYIDKNKTGTCNGIKIISLTQFEPKENTLVIVSNKYEYRNIGEELQNCRGVKKENLLYIEEVIQKMEEEQYFEKRCINVETLHGGLIDAGCYDGRDTMRYLNMLGKRVWAFEPNIDYYNVCMRLMKDVKGVTLYPYAVADRCMENGFIQDGTSSRINEDDVIGKEKVTTVTIDSVLKGEQIGFIKMDIEGYEAQALTGAKEMIKKFHPVLAICVYHKKSDIWRIPQIILDIDASYNFYMGHYRIGAEETVLYAV